MLFISLHSNVAWLQGIVKRKLSLAVRETGNSNPRRITWVVSEQIWMMNPEMEGD